MLQIQDEIGNATKQLCEQREKYNGTELCIMDAEISCNEGMDSLLSKFKNQKAELHRTRKHIAALSEKGIAVQITLYNFTDLSQCGIFIMA